MRIAFHYKVFSRSFSPNRFLFLCALILLGAGPGHALVGNWTSYTHLGDIRDLQEWKGSMYAATGGGIIKISSNRTQEVYRNTEGLRDVAIMALASDPAGDLYATSELGYVYRYRAARNDWEVLSTAYRGARWKMRKRSLVYRSGYLVMGSDNGLSFFNVAKKIADANVSKMEFASAPKVNSVLFVGDTLFAGTNSGIFRVTLSLDKLLTNPITNIFNPAIWSKVPGTEGVLFFNPATVGGDSAKLADSLLIVKAANEFGGPDALEYAHGFLHHGAAGIGSAFSGMEIPEHGGRIIAFDSVSIDGKAVAPAFTMEVIGFLNGVWFTGANSGMFLLYPQLGGYDYFLNDESLPREALSAIKADHLGIHILATPTVYRLKGKTWEAIPGLVVKENSAVDTKVRGNHAFDVRAMDEFYVGTWGGGLNVLRDGKQSDFDALNSCIVTAVANNPNYALIWSQVPYKDKGIWFTYMVGEIRYSIGYYDFAKGGVTCFEPQVNALKGKNIQLVGNNLTVVTERGVEAFRIIDNGVSVALDPVNRIKGLALPGSVTLAGKADRYGNFWITTESSTLLYVPGLAVDTDSAKSFRTLDGFTGTSCKHLEIDPQGHIWAGCSEGGVFEIIPGKDSLSHTFRQYGLNEGLLSELVFALDVNPENGDVWIATEKGISRFESASRPTKANLAQAKVFPNPFLPKHESVIFSGLSPESEIQVLTQSGSVVFHQSLRSGTGDEIRWNGRNRAGARVREGVYFYVIRSPKDAKNGKIIVAR